LQCCPCSHSWRDCTALRLALHWFDVFAMLSMQSFLERLQGFEIGSALIWSVCNAVHAVVPGETAGLWDWLCIDLMCLQCCPCSHSWRDCRALRLALHCFDLFAMLSMQSFLERLQGFEIGSALLWSVCNAVHAVVPGETAGLWDACRAAQTRDVGGHAGNHWESAPAGTRLSVQRSDEMVHRPSNVDIHCLWSVQTWRRHWTRKHLQTAQGLIVRFTQTDYVAYRTTFCFIYKQILMHFFSEVVKYSMLERLVIASYSQKHSRMYVIYLLYFICFTSSVKLSLMYFILQYFQCSVSGSTQTVYFYEKVMVFWSSWLDNGRASDV